MKAVLVIALLIAIIASQTTVTPKTQTCVCTNLLNQADCIALSGCAWTATNTTNSTNTTTTTGTCANQTTTQPVVNVSPTYCGSVTNASTACAGTIGCSYYNSTCQIFTGCSAYVQTTNAACQAISTQCTTDGIRCVLPGACSTYTTQALCSGNIATSGARQCKWTAGTGTSGTCGDMICTDAPATYNTLALCQGWISTCFSTGKGCVASLGLCSSYTIAAGCTGMIGSDGVCTANTALGSTACRSLACTDAPSTTATNSACNTFLSGCVSTGKGCVSTLSACNSYAQTLGCTGLIGSDGACTTDTTAGATNCRALACTDAPASTNTDAACVTFKTGCQTTGSGCVATRGTCSSYQGTATTCTSFIGTDGNCKGTGTTVGSCAVKLCTDAPTTSNTNSACAAFQTGCLTTGAGCVSSLGSCSTYTGTATTCTQYIGSDGNCTAPASQTTASACVAKVCTDGVFTTNSACQTFSYKCVTNGTNCILPGTCETIGTALTCQGSSTCNSGSLCLNRSSCVNYTTQSQCLLNQQQYVSSGTTYLRACTWTSTCVNKLCTEQAATLTTDSACGTALAGCVTTGAGCVDISVACSAYQGTNLTCLNFKGLNGTKVCTQLQTQTTAAACIDRICDNATTANGTTATYASSSACQAYLSTCYWNGNTGCTSGGCSTYFGLQTTCSAITTAGVPCWSTSTAGANVACINKDCSHAQTTLTTDSQCAAFMTGCVTNGAGCVPSSTLCAAYKGNSTQCSAFKQNTNQQCQQLAASCKAKSCSDTIPSPSIANCAAYLSTCTFINGACATKGICTSYTVAAANGATQCPTVTNASGVACTYSTGITCAERSCTDTIASPSIANCAAYLSTCTFVNGACATKGACTSYTVTAANGATQCPTVTNASGVACTYSTGLTCAERSCADSVDTPSDANCAAYLSTCTFMNTSCITKAASCDSYTPQPAEEYSQCENAKIASGAGCVYGGAGKCIQRTCTQTVSSPSVANCAAYLSTCTYIGTSCLAKAACTSYTPTSGSEASQCAAATNTSGVACTYSTGTKCAERACTDTVASASLTTCPAYLSTCTFLNGACVTKGACSTYTVTTANGAASCPTVTNASGVACTYAGGTETKCADKACTDTIASPSAPNCTAYLSSCQFNGTVCVGVAACNTYDTVGSTDTDKTNNCNRLTGSDGKCTYLTGAKCQASAACNSYSLTSLDACALRRNTSGTLCSFSATIDATKCAERTCEQVLIEATCNDTWLVGCMINSSPPCSVKACNLAATTLTTNAACATYRQGCVTNGAGCIESSALCADYKGTQSACQTFTGGTDGLCNNVAGATATTACIARTCAANTTATTNAVCTTWKSGCVWTGTTGCKDISNCAAFNGTIDTCPTFTASDGPCSGTGSTSAACVSNSTTCNQAPATYTTHAQCQTWHATCITNGFGCISSTGFSCNQIVSSTVCPLYKPALSIGGSNVALGCDLANECLTKPSTCGAFTTAFQCNNVPISGSTTVTCAWNQASSTCGPLTCALLPVTLTTDSACSAAISTCTTNGSGCVTKAACSTYNKVACGPAATTDTQKSCIWASSVCRPIVCSDNTTATSDAACNTYLTGCRTTGLGCSNSLTCSTFTSAAFCLKDQSNNPCLWYRGACINYTKCTDVAAATHTLCQLVSPLCTTNGTTCVAITGCSATTLQASCILGTDGNCGWLPAAGTASAQCALYTSCTAAQGATTAQCLLWGSTCVSNGTSCIAKTTCSSYNTQVGCSNAGTDGTCFYVAPTGTATTGTCRLQLCSDATAATATSISIHTGCVGFSASTACTTSGTGCVSQSTCGSYTAQAGCVQGTDGVCFWATASTNATATTPATTSSVCRLKQCTDSLLTTSSSCAPAITGLKCVSNGVNCIPQSTCSSYTAREACLGGGSDGQCAFTPGTNSTTPNLGTCAQFTSCASANSDSVTCGIRSDACFFNSTTTNGTTTTSCSTHTCATKALGSTCQAIPSFDLSTYSICVLTGTTCAAGNPSSFTAAQCYSNSVKTYSWNPLNNVCQSCQAQNTTINNTQNQNNTNNTYGYLISLLISLVIMI